MRNEIHIQQPKSASPQQNLKRRAAKTGSMQKLINLFRSESFQRFNTRRLGKRKVLNKIYTLQQQQSTNLHCKRNKKDICGMPLTISPGQTRMNFRGEKEIVFFFQTQFPMKQSLSKGFRAEASFTACENYQDMGKRKLSAKNNISCLAPII